MASLTGSSIASTYDRLLALPSGGGATTTLVAITDGDAGTLFAAQLSTTTLCIDNPTASSASQGGILRLQSDDEAALGTGHRLGVIEFGAAEDTGSTITTGARIEALNSRGSAWDATNNHTDLLFYTTTGDASQSEQLRITSDGNVGIGTDSPDGKLHVYSATAGSVTADADHDELTLENSAACGMTILSGASSHGTIAFGDEADNNDGILGYDQSGQSMYIKVAGVNTKRFLVDTNSRISLSNNDLGNSNTVFGKSAGAALISGGNNNVFLGEDAGNDITTGIQNVAIGYNTLDQGTSDTDNNVAIGYAAMHGAFTDEVVNDCVAVGSRALEGGLKGGVSGTVAIGKSALHALTTGATNTAIGYQAMKVHTIGNNNTILGYGTMGDTGATTTQASCVVENTNATVTHPTNSVIVVGMGVTGPGIPAGARVITKTDTEGFELSANATADGTVTLTFSGALASDNNVFVGFNSGNGTWTYSESSENVAIGSKTMDANLDGSNFNVAVGHQSLTDLTSGGYNTCLGARTGTNLTTGGTNVAVGMDSLYTSTDVDRCVFIGSDSGQGLLTSAADGTVGIGYSALNACTTGVGNIAIGYESMKVHTTGGYNICIGQQTMVDTDDHADVLGSNNNVFIGYQSGGGIWSTNDSNFNVGVGNYTLDDAMNGAERNTAIGDNAGSAITSGSSNTCIGASAGQTLTTGGTNTFVGRLADGAASTGNQIGIGFTAVCGAADCIAIGTSITNSTTQTVKFGNTGGSMISQDWDSAGDSTWVRSSDRRKKRNIKDNTLGLEFINKLQTRTFQMKPQNELPKEWVSYSETNRYDTEKVHIGFIAQELKELIDEYGAPDEIASWSEDEDGMQRAGETKLITPLIKAVQELSAQVEELKNK